MAEDEGTTTDDGLPADRAQWPFRPGPDRDPDRPPSTCRFLVVETADGTLEPAGSDVDAANRCAAVGDPVPQSLRQQELVCFAAAHVNCPRYLRGILLAATPPSPPARQPVSRAVIGASLVLAASLAASFGFLAVRGGFNLPVASGPPVLVAVVGSPSAGPTIAATAAPTPSPTLAPSPSPSPSPSPTPAPTPTATPAASPTATPPPATPTPRPSSDRYAVLTRCPSTPDCWIYVIRAGDNLQSIAHWFGVSYSRMLTMNPGLRVPIHPGDQLRIPTPTR